MNPLPIVYNDAEYEVRYKELHTCRVSVPENVVELGFGSIALYLAKIQGYKDRVSSMLSEVLQIQGKAKMQLNDAKFLYETKLDALIDMDPEIVNLPSDKMKIARANKKLTEERQRVQDATAVYHMITTYVKSVEVVLENLVSADKSLTEQGNIYKRMHPPVQPQYPPRQFPGSVNPGQ